MGSKGTVVNDGNGDTKGTGLVVELGLVVNDVVLRVFFLLLWSVEGEVRGDVRLELSGRKLVKSFDELLVVRRVGPLDGGAVVSMSPRTPHATSLTQGHRHRQSPWPRRLG